MFDKNNQLIDGATMISRDLVCIKCYVIYYRHFMSKWHGITLKLVVVKNIYQGKIIVDGYNIHRFITYHEIFVIPKNQLHF